MQPYPRPPLAYPPAAIPQPTHYPASSEPFGAVDPPVYQSSPQQQQRRRQSPYVLSPMSFGGEVSSPQHQSRNDEVHPHNGIIAFFLVPPLFLALWNHVSPYPLQTFLYVALIIYALDLANFRDLFIGMVWVGALIMTFVSGGTALFDGNDDEAAASHVPLIVMRLFCETLLFVCVVSMNCTCIITCTIVLDTINWTNTWTM